MSRAKRRIDLPEGSSYVVLPNDDWRYLVGVFRQLADYYAVDADEHRQWLAFAEEVTEQYMQNANFFEEEEDWV